jgi:hypothetical protein
MVRHVTEKLWEYDLDLYEIFIDFRKDYDNILREKLYEAFVEFKIPSK